MKSFLKVLIALSGLYCLVHILFDLSVGPVMNIATNIIQALFFLLVLVYITFFRKVAKH